ncbi:MAG: oligosaccharide flippase family protein [Bacteroidales bacterium]|nr:oligosaccharide flippase family protein [Bacteroidales bacterium]
MYSIVNSIINISQNLFKKDLFRSLSIYTFVGFVQKTFPFLLLPFLTRILTPADYGIIAMFATVKSFFGPFLGLGSISAVERYYFDKKEIDFPVFLSNVLLIVFGTTIIFGFLLLLLGNQFTLLTKIPKQFLWIVIVVSFGTVINRINLILFRVQNKSTLFALLSLFETAMYFFLMIVFVIWLRFNWKADLYSQLIVFSLLAIGGMRLLTKGDLIKFSLNTSYLKSALTFGIPMFVHTFGLFFVNMTDKLLITHFVGIEATGIFNIGFKMATIIVFFVTAFNNAYVPWLYRKLKSNNLSSVKLAFKSSIYSCIAVTIAGLILILFLPIIYPFFIGSKFNSSLNISMYIVIGEIFNAYYLLLISYILFDKATKYVMFITIITSLISVSLNYFLIQYYGVIGAAITLLCVYFAKFMLTFIFVYRIYKKKYAALQI